METCIHKEIKGENWKWSTKARQSRVSVSAPLVTTPSLTPKPATLQPPHACLFRRMFACERPSCSESIRSMALMLRRSVRVGSERS